MARVVWTAILAIAGLGGCGGAVRDARTIPTSDDVATSDSETALEAVDEDGFTQVRETLNQLGAVDHASHSVVLDAMMATGFAYRVSENDGEMMGSPLRDAFGEVVYVHSPRDLDWSEVVDEVDAILGSFQTDPYNVQRYETFAASVAALARNAERANRTEIARVLYRRALAAPHDSRPTADASPTQRLIGDVALMALRRALRKYANDSSFTRQQLRGLLTEIAAIPNVEPAGRAAELVAGLDEMIALEDRTPATDREALVLYWDQAYALSQLQDGPLEVAMQTYEPLLDSEILTRMIDHRSGETDLRRLRHVVVDIMGQIAGQEFPSVARARAWWDGVRADNGISESFEFLERNQNQSQIDYRMSIHVRRLYSADAAAADRRVRRMFRRGSPQFRNQILQSFMGLRDVDEALIRPYILDSLGSDDRSERATAASLASYRGTPSDEYLDRMAAMLPEAIENRTEYDELLPTLANGLLAGGRPELVAANWTDLPHRIRAQLAMQVPADAEVEVVRPILLDESTLSLTSPTMGCVTLTTADFVYVNRRVAAGDSVDCEASPEERRASREREAGTPTAEPRTIHTITGEGIRVFVDGPETLATALQEGDVIGTPEGLRQLIVRMVVAQSDPTLAIVAFRRRGENLEVEIRARNTNSAMGGINNMAYTRSGADSEMIPESGVPVWPRSAMFSGAAPYSWLTDALTTLVAGEIDAIYMESRW